MIINLSDLQAGKTARVVGIELASPAARQRLFACGVVPGAEVTVERIAPLGDPMQVKIENLQLSIRKAEGRYVKVDSAHR